MSKLQENITCGKVTHFRNFILALTSLYTVSKVYGYIANITFCKNMSI